jgi:hypothetical protein
MSSNGSILANCPELFAVSLDTNNLLGLFGCSFFSKE